MVKNPPVIQETNCSEETRFSPWVEKTPRRRKWTTPVFLPGISIDRGTWWAAVHGVTNRSDSAQQLNFNHGPFKNFPVVPCPHRGAVLHQPGWSWDRSARWRHLWSPEPLGRTGFVIIIVHFGADDITHPDYLFNLPASAENAFHLFPACGGVWKMIYLHRAMPPRFSIY